MSKYFWAHLKLYCGSIKGTSVNFYSKEKQDNLTPVFRSSLPEVFCKKGVLRNFAKFAGKHQYQSLKKEKHSRWLLLGITQEYYYSFDSANLLFLCSTDSFLQVHHIKHYKHFVERFDRVYAVIDCSGVGIF